MFTLTVKKYLKTKKLVFLLTAFLCTAVTADNQRLTCQFNGTGPFIDPVQSGRYRSDENEYIFGARAYDKYRIPSLAQLNNGDIVFFAEYRPQYYVFNDFKSQSIIMRVKKKSGELTDSRIILRNRDAEGATTDNSNYKHNLMNPVSVYNKKTGVLHMFYNHIISYKNDNLALRVFVMHSSSKDNGETWSIPVNLSRTFGEECETLIVGPGRAVWISSDEPYANRIVVPLHTIGEAGKDGTKYPLAAQCDPDNTIGRGLFKVAYSDDDGVTWETSNRLDSGVDQGFYTESQIVSLKGQLHLLSRLGGSYQYRATGLAYSDDGGKTWLRGFNENGPVNAEGENVGVSGRFVTPTQPGLATDGENIYYTTTAFYSSSKSLSNRREAWIHRIDPDKMLSMDDSPVNVAQPITKSGFSNSAALYLGDGKIGVLWEEVRSWTLIPAIRNIYYTVFNVDDFREIDDPAWLSRGFTYYPVKNGSRNLLNPYIFPSGNILSTETDYSQNR